ncbi:MAG: 3'-5' exonuclease [Arenicellales bacterium WSBS_2016_MAG_OTU3]
MNFLIFDIETIPDTVAGRKLHQLDDLSDKEIAEIMFAKRREQTNGSEFMAHYLHRIVAISAVLRSGNSIKIWSLGDHDSSEGDLIKRFFDGIEKYTPEIVSWNGSGFDLPVLHYRSLLNDITAPRYWDMGQEDRDFKWNNYISRFHWRHIDLMDVLSGYQPRANAPLSEIAQLLGFPGKLGMAGNKVWDTWLTGDLKSIRDYCETDVLNTYLVFLKFQKLRGVLSDSELKFEFNLLSTELAESSEEHLQQFLKAWQDGSPGV